MILVAIKPLSVNDAWKGRRYKTKEYKAYEKELLYRLPPKLDVPEGKLKIELEFGFSSKGSDGENPVKCFIDVLQTKYGFNDNRIYRYEINKEIVKKGFEYIKFRISSFE